MVDKAKTDTDVSSEDMEYMNGAPTRLEVANYVNNLLEEHYIPLIVEATKQLAVLQAVLITKGIVSKNELEAVFREWAKLIDEELETEDPC